MKVYLLPIAEDRCIFYSEAPQRDGGSASPCGPEGPPTWLRRQFHRAKERLFRSRHDASPIMRRLLGVLERFHAPDESTLHRLRKTDRVEVLHPVTMSSEEAGHRWSEYISQCYRRHVWRTAINTLICPLTIVLAPLPGPNIIGYWFVYRAASNGLASWGTRRVRKGLIEVEFQPCPALDELMADEAVAPLQEECGRQTLQRFLARRRKTPALVARGARWSLES